PDVGGAPAWVAPPVEGLPELSSARSAASELHLNSASAFQPGTDDLDQRLRKLQAGEERGKRPRSPSQPAIKATPSRGASRSSARSPTGKHKSSEQRAAFQLHWWF